MSRYRRAAPPAPTELAQVARPHRRGCPASFGEFLFLIRADLHRYAGDTRFASFLRHFLLTPGYKYSTVMRLCGYLLGQPLGRATLYPPIKWWLLMLRYKYGIAIPEYTIIGPGLFINRFGGIMLHGDCIIGENFNVTHGAMLGQINRGQYLGAPIVGDRVFLAAGAKVLGRVTLGDDCAVGVNSVVTKDVPAAGVAVGMPARVVSSGGSGGYVNRQYDSARFAGGRG